MEFKKKLKKIKKAIIIIINIILLFVMFYLMLISPYDYEWDERLKQVDEDALLVLTVLWRLVAIVIPILALFSRPKKKRYYLWYVTLMCIAIFNVVIVTLIGANHIPYDY